MSETNNPEIKSVNIYIYDMFEKSYDDYLDILQNNKAVTETEFSNRLYLTGILLIKSMHVVIWVWFFLHFISMGIMSLIIGQHNLDPLNSTLTYILSFFIFGIPFVMTHGLITYFIKDSLHSIRRLHANLSNKEYLWKVCDYAAQVLKALFFQSLYLMITFLVLFTIHIPILIYEDAKKLTSS